MKFSTIILSILLFASCMGPVDQKTLKPISSKPTIDEFSGKWIADTFTLKMMNIEKTDNRLPLSIVLNKDSTFKATNFPVDLADLSPSKKNLISSGTGKWSLINIRDEWGLDLTFFPNPSYQKTFSQSYSIYLKDSRPVLLMFVGDPDQGNRILLTKE